MILGETHHPDPTVHVPPWLYLNDNLTANNHFSNNSNPFYLQETLAALQCYLPSDEADVESDSELSALEYPDSTVDAYSCDHFRMFEFKVRRCVLCRSHDWAECPYAHPGEKARRRDPRKFHYSGTACSDFRRGNCRNGDSCEFAHGVFECWLHPARYRTLPCKDGSGCRRRVCFFAHTPDQLRVVNFADSCNSSPCAKAMPFSGSPVSTPAESSPPVSPMAQSPSGSLCLAPSINTMVASLRNLQLGKVKCLPSSGFGSPRGAVTRPGIGYLDFWDEGCEEEPVMESVESGRHSLERVNSGQCSGGPDEDWVSELVN